MIEHNPYRFGDDLRSHERVASERFDSDRDALPFPIGGVFGPITRDEPYADEVWDTGDVIDAIERVIGRMQHQLDNLEAGVEDVIAQIGAHGVTDSSDDDWRPSAA